MNDDIDTGVEPSSVAWAVFGDLMSVLMGAFVLILVGVIALQLELSTALESEVKKRLDLSDRLQTEVQHREEETQRRQALEQALAVPLAAGQVTLVDGRIGISGSVLFALNSDQLQPEGRAVLQSLIEPLTEYLKTHDEVLMVSGFTDDQPIHQNNRRYADNWELSAQRALTVTRALITEGISPDIVFAAAFGEQRPVADNSDEAGRASNRRVEIAPIPKSSNSAGSAGD
ncbi:MULTISPECIES: OmpA family protein [unclassified Bordetella]|uniref:OmpA family protein n=1 Tax=unclassified Bordetella TaxID=2630031 RepID=UPI0013229B62|nr:MULTISPECIES: OmpA family protein [unclassified Bordetella]MVW70918.1 OmpA family protein [Bordetella sp. 15P40C-2]MVW79485.1 OmpA family protein [Bordetella sp. 02P26C-1]